MKLLIVAMPKSASTSLQKFLCKEMRHKNANQEIRKRAFSKFLRAMSVADLVSKSNPLFYWHSDLFYGNESIISAICHLRGDFIAKIHLGKLEPNQFERLSRSVDYLVYCRRDLYEVLEAYRRGEDSGIYPNLYGKRVNDSDKKEMTNFLRAMDSYWCEKADEILNFTDLTAAGAFPLMGQLFKTKDFPKERFSREDNPKQKRKIYRMFLLYVEKVIALTGLNNLYIRRILLGFLRKY
jgi:hypothetical protein